MSAATLQEDRAKAKREARITDGTAYLDQFLRDRIAYPWPDGYMNYAGSRGVPARVLYERYVATEPDPLLREQEFGEAVRRLGYRSQRDEQGISWPTFYCGWLERDETRADRAAAEVESFLTGRVWADGYDTIKRDHMERAHSGEDDMRLTGYGDSSWWTDTCSHVMPESVLAPLREECALIVDRAKADGTFDRLVEEKYGPYLRWTPGDPDPWRREGLTETLRGLAKAESAVSDAEDRFLVARAALDAIPPEPEATPEELEYIAGHVQPDDVLTSMVALVAKSRLGAPDPFQIDRASARNAALDLVAEIESLRDSVERATQRLTRCEAEVQRPFWPVSWRDEEADEAVRTAELEASEERRRAVW